MEKIKSALQAAQSAITEAMASCNGSSGAEEDEMTESDSPEMESAEDTDMEKRAIAASIKKALSKE